jgi:hypothetical protein
MTYKLIAGGLAVAVRILERRLTGWRSGVIHKMTA